MGFEERLGTQWTVWVGGVALALGGFFLVRYSIEQGWFGPGMRIILGGLLALVLIAAGEWARRKENLSGIGGVPAAVAYDADGRVAAPLALGRDQVAALLRVDDVRLEVVGA